ncbi:MAG: hypothetical protein ACI9W2_003201 [Gammaproteobacteria bacterium]|jgi:hypothetical protein
MKPKSRQLRALVALAFALAANATLGETLSRSDFANSYLDTTERERIARVMCGTDSYLAHCVGPVSKAANPRDNGQRLSAKQCTAFFRTQLAVALHSGSDNPSPYYDQLPSELNESQARVQRQGITKELQALVVESLTAQGAKVDQSHICAGRLVNTISRIEQGGSASYAAAAKDQALN